MIEVKVFGGLGNQMFQYAFMLYLQEKNADVKLNISDYQVHEHHYGFELEKVFGISGPYTKEPCSFTINQNSIFIRSVQKLFHCTIGNSKEVKEYQGHMIINKDTFVEDVFFNGFWQDVRYIKNHEKNLKEAFQFAQPLGDKNQQAFDSWKNRETVSVHIRRGDYMNNSSLGGICDMEYYKSAVDYIKENIENPLFVFFSDDIPWCKEAFADLKAEFVNWNQGQDSYRDMQMMSLCKHNIIANSTFSWWGAFLNENPDKKVIMPKKWFQKTEVNPLAMEGWILL